MLYLTYDNEGLADGAGAQLQRILSIYLIAKAYSLGYLHRGLKRLSYQGAKCLEENAEDPRQIGDYNALFTLPSTPCEGGIQQAFKVFDISEEIIERFRDQESTLLIVQFAGTMIDRNPSLMLKGCSLFPWTLRPMLLARPVIVAVHVRRGELFVVDSDRMLPNSYYIECMKALAEIFSEAGLAFEFRLHTEVLSKEVVVTPGHHGICDRIRESVTVRPEDSRLEEFSGIPRLSLRVNEYPVDTLKGLASADVLLASRSSFSYVAGMIKTGVVLFHPFWHALSPGWIPTRSGKDVYEAREQILSGLNAFKV